jgi:hypothetical protein
VSAGASVTGMASTVDRFVRDGRLVRLPAKRWRRRHERACERIIGTEWVGGRLEHLVGSFEPGRRFSEREVDEGLLSRADGRYWRSGGWVDVLGA